MDPVAYASSEESDDPDPPYVALHPTSMSLPAVRRVVTGHSSTAKSVVLLDELQQARFLPGSQNHQVHDLGWQDRVPAQLNSGIDTDKFVDEVALHQNELLPAEGVVFRCFDHAPGAVTPYHRTISLDYGIVTKGQLVLVLDDDQRVVLNTGDVIVQRGTAHSWRNETEEYARIFFVGVGAKPIKINGSELKEDLSNFREMGE